MVPLNKILVPLDGSRLAERALDPAVILARATGAELHLMRVTAPLIRHVGSERYEQLALTLNENEAKMYLSDELSRLSEAGVVLSAHTTVGPIADEIITFSQQHRIDLIIMSSHGRSGPGRWVFGSIAEKVLRQATCATLVIRARAEVEPFSQKRILVPLDGSTLAERALAPAFTIASAVGASVVLLRVVGPGHIPVIAGQPELEGESVRLPLPAELEDEAHDYLRQVAGNLDGYRVPIETQTALGPVAGTIIDFAAERGVDLIAISSHGRSGISRWVLGSVAEKVLHGASCATLVVHQPR
jgi:nucleotide-binding universal stress UspA family protein